MLRQLAKRKAAMAAAYDQQAGVGPGAIAGVIAAQVVAIQGDAGARLQGSGDRTRTYRIVFAPPIAQAPRPFAAAYTRRPRPAAARSAERRVGKECVRTCR